MSFPPINFDFTSLYPNTMRQFNIVPTEIRAIIRKNKINKLFDLG